MGRAHLTTLQSVLCFATDFSWADLHPNLLEEQLSVQHVTSLTMGLEPAPLTMPGSILINCVQGMHALIWLLLVSPLSLF